MCLTSFDRDGYTVLPDAVTATEREAIRRGGERLLATPLTRGRDRGAHGLDGFRGCVALDPDTFLPLISKPAVLRFMIAALSPNIYVLSTHFISLPSVAPGAPRPPERRGWHRDMYGVPDDLGHAHTPRLSIKCAFYLTDITPDCGMTLVVPGSNRLVSPPEFRTDAIDPDGAITPRLNPCDALLFENRTWHASGLNSSGQPRLAFMITYGYRWLAPVDDPVPEALLGDPNLTDIQRQLLGARDRNPDGSLARGLGSQPLRRWYEEQLSSDVTVRA